MSKLEAQAAPESRFFSLPRGLPLFCGLLPVVWCLAYGLTLLIVGSLLGRQSSTAGIPAFFSFIAALPLALVGLQSGRVAALLLRPWDSRSMSRVAMARMTRRCAPLLLAGIAVMASWKAAAPLYAADHAARPRILVNSVQLSRVDAPSIGQVVPALRVHDHLRKLNLPIPWREGARLFDHGDRLELGLEKGRSLMIPLAGIDYVNFVDATAFDAGMSRNSWLVLLITGRATGRRDLLAVISDAGELVYLELLERVWDFNSAPLATTPSPAGELILLGPDGGNPLRYALRDAA